MPPSILLAVILVFAVVRYARGLFGRQELRPRRLRIRLVMSAVVGVALILLAGTQLPILAGELTGVVLGAALGWLALHLTTIERTENAIFYRPNTYISLGVLALWIGRILFRLAAVVPAATVGASGGARSIQVVSDPLTGAAYLVLIAYFTCYSALLLRAS